jgi:hypothetical protein
MRKPKRFGVRPDKPTPQGDVVGLSRDGLRHPTRGGKNFRKIAGENTERL